MNGDLFVFLGGLTALIAVNRAPLTWFFRQTDYGSLLLDVGRIEKSKFWWGIALVIVLIFSWFLEQTGLPLSLVRIERLPAYLTAIVYLIAAGLSHLELREKGICYRFKLIKWSKIESYKWELNLLTINLKRNGELSWLIPIDYRDSVNHILAEHLPGNYPCF